MADASRQDSSDLDAFFNAAESRQTDEVLRVAGKLAATGSDGHEDAQPHSETSGVTGIFDELHRVLDVDDLQTEIQKAIPEDLPPQPDPVPELPPRPVEPVYAQEGKKKKSQGKFIAIDPTAIPGHKENPEEPFVLVPANIYEYVPWWGWAAIGISLLMLMAGVVLMPVVSLSRAASALGDEDETKARQAMQRLVMRGDERTVKKLFSMATSEKAGISARLRAIDTMSLIERVPEVDRALLRLELSSQTDPKVRDAAIAARKQREAYRTRGH